MLRILFVMALFCVCSGLDLNGGLTRKYAFMKIMSGCLGEDFVMMVKEQMMKACAECHGRDMNDTQQINLDYLMNDLRNSQQHNTKTPLTHTQPMYIYQPIIYPIFLQNPYSAPPFSQFPVQHHHVQPFQPNTFSHHSPSQPASYQPINIDVNPNIPQHFQPNTFSHHSPSQPASHQPINIDINPNIPHDLQGNDLHNLQTPQLRSPIPNNQLGYPDSLHHERQFSDLLDGEKQFFDVHDERQFYELNPQPVEAQKRKRRSLQPAPENLETLMNNLSLKIGNMTCVFRALGWLTEENDVNFTFVEQQIKNINLHMKLQEDLLYIHETCKDFSMCMPIEKSKHPLMRELGGALSYMKCINTKAVTACMKHDFRMYQAKMGYGSSDIGGLSMEMVGLLGHENTNPSQLAEDIGSLVFADDAQLPL